jgi:hypothetical protein
MACGFWEDEEAMSIALVRTLPEDDWRCFVEQNPAGTIFHTPEMFQVFARAQGHRPTLWAAVNNKQQPKAARNSTGVTTGPGSAQSTWP